MLIKHLDLVNDDLGHPESSLPNSYQMVHMKSWHSCIGMIDMATKCAAFMYQFILLRDAFLWMYFRLMA